jgi:hypothetical protein
MWQVKNKFLVVTYICQLATQFHAKLQLSSFYPDGLRLIFDLFSRKIQDFEAFGKVLPCRIWKKYDQKVLGQKIYGVNNWSPSQFFVPKIFLVFFFKLYMIGPFQNAQTIAFWFSKWKVMTVWRYFFGQFLIKNRVNFKKLFLENKKYGISKILTTDS